jgi:hypothetical protein
VGVQDVTGSGVDHDDEPLDVAGHRQGDLPAQPQVAGTQQEPGEPRGDRVGERTGGEDRLAFGGLRQHGRHGRYETVHVDSRRWERLAELVDRAEFVRPRHGDMPGGGEHRVLCPDPRRRGGRVVDRDHAAQRGRHRALRVEAHGLGGLEDADAVVLLVQVNRSRSGAGGLHDRIRQEFDRLGRGQPEYGRHGAHVVERAGGEAADRRGSAGRVDPGGVAGDRVQRGDAGGVRSGQAVRDLPGEYGQPLLVPLPLNGPDRLS